MGFEHSPFEVFYTEAMTSYVICDASGEDPSCSNQFPLANEVVDHVTYLGT